jgi:hypothetical protein
VRVAVDAARSRGRGQRQVAPGYSRTPSGLPIKLHTGYLSGNAHPLLATIGSHVRDVTHLAQRYPEARFVLMHVAWPDQEHLLAVGKHCPNVVVDPCWSWTLAPLSAQDFVARFAHSSEPAGSPRRVRSSWFRFSCTTTPSGCSRFVAWVPSVAPSASCFALRTRYPSGRLAREFW